MTLRSRTMTVRSRTMTVRSRTSGLPATCEVAPLSIRTDKPASSESDVMARRGRHKAVVGRLCLTCLSRNTFGVQRAFARTCWPSVSTQRLVEEANLIYLSVKASQTAPKDPSEKYALHVAGTLSIRTDKPASCESDVMARRETQGSRRETLSYMPVAQYSWRLNGLLLELVGPVSAHSDWSRKRT